MKPKISSSFILFTVAGLVAVGLVAYVATRPIVSATPQSSYVFAQCLTDKGAIMYGAWWCSHCLANKKLFGAAFEKVHYVECSEPDGKTVTQPCKDAKITGYPTWTFADGSRAEGSQSFAQLGAKSGCAVPTP